MRSHAANLIFFWAAGRCSDWRRVRLSARPFDPWARISQNRSRTSHVRTLLESSWALSTGIKQRSRPAGARCIDRGALIARRIAASSVCERGFALPLDANRHRLPSKASYAVMTLGRLPPCPSTGTSSRRKSSYLLGVPPTRALDPAMGGRSS